MFISLEFIIWNINKLLYLIHFKTVVIILSSFRFLSRGKIGAPRPFGNWGIMLHGTFDFSDTNCAFHPKQRAEHEPVGHAGCIRARHVGLRRPPVRVTLRTGIQVGILAVSREWPHRTPQKS